MACDPPPRWLNDADPVVISGMSGRFPGGCDSVQTFADALYDGTDLVQEDEDHQRWPSCFEGLPPRHGCVHHASHFDAQFFSVLPVQTSCMDAHMRLLLEVAHEALLDAGLDPQALRGKRTGVFLGAGRSVAETVEVLTARAETIPPYLLIGTARVMFANRL